MGSGFISRSDDVPDPVCAAPSPDAVAPLPDLRFPIPLGFGISSATRNLGLHPPPENGNQLLGQHAVLPQPHPSSPYLTELGFKIID